MFIKLCLKDSIFQVFHTDDIISIDPSWFAEGAFDCYHLRLASQEYPMEITEKQANQLLETLEYKAISQAD